MLTGRDIAVVGRDICVPANGKVKADFVLGIKPFPILNA